MATRERIRNKASNAGKRKTAKAVVTRKATVLTGVVTLGRAVCQCRLTLVALKPG